jgi:uncharacterized protein YqiB (DUF1249 family)
MALSADFLTKLYTQQSKTYTEVEALFEENYLKILQLIPALKAVKSHQCLVQNNSPNLYLLLENRFTHTGIFTLTHQIGLLNQPDIKFKIYFDARLLEVISVCKKTQLNKQHPHLSNCSDTNIRWELNLFMARWLDYCLEKYPQKLWKNHKN